MREVLVIALVLACPLMMIMMMRGGHGHGGHAQAPRADESQELSTESLRKLRADVDLLISEREQKK